MLPCQRSETLHGSSVHHLEAVLTFLMPQYSLQVTSLESWLIKVNTCIYNISLQFRQHETDADEDRSFCFLTVPEVLWVLVKIQSGQAYAFCSV